MGRGACLAVSSRQLGQRQRRPDKTHQRAGETIGNLPSRSIHMTLVVRDRDGRPQEDLHLCTASVCVAVVRPLCSVFIQKQVFGPHTAKPQPI